METVNWPVDVSDYFLRARSIVAPLATNTPITSAILDNWNTGENITGARIIFGGPDAEQCQSDYSNCPIFQKLGEDKPNLQTGLRATLCRATEEQRILFPSKQRFLNCKTTEQYKESFVRFFIQCCNSKEMLEAELEWVKGFRLLFIDDIHDLPTLKEREWEMKRYIVNEVLRRLNESGDMSRHNIVRQYVQNWKNL